MQVYEGYEELLRTNTEARMRYLTTFETFCPSSGGSRVGDINRMPVVRGVGEVRMSYRMAHADCLVK